MKQQNNCSDYCSDYSDFKVITVICMVAVLFLNIALSPSFASAGRVKKPAAKPQEETAQEVPTDSDQQILEFNMAGFADKGKKAWEIKGSSADIFTDIVKLYDIKANFYDPQDTMNLTSKNGFYDKQKNFIHLDTDVVLTTASGGRLTTDSLDWDRERQFITTNDIVNIHKENIDAVGLGMDAHMNINKVNLRENVTVTINPAAPDAPKTVITCDGPLEIDYDKQKAIFNRNVKVDDKGGRGQLYSDKMEVNFDYETKKVNSIIATEKPRVFLYSADQLGGLLDAPAGN